MCYEVASATTNLSTFIFLSLAQLKVFLWITFELEGMRTQQEVFY